MEWGEGSGDLGVDALREGFARAYRERYGYLPEDRPIEVEVFRESSQVLEPSENPYENVAVYTDGLAPGTFTTGC